MSNVNIDTEVRQAIWSRRNFLKAGAGVALSTFGFAALPFLSANAAPGELNVVVVGGGYGGATVAKYLKMWSKDSALTVNVTMIEPNAEFMSPIMSGMVVTGALEVDRISFNYDRLTQVHGVEWVQDRVTSIDSEVQTVTLGDGVTIIAYDKLILSPGIDFVDIDGWDKEKIPHAWGGRDQALLLAACGSGSDTTTDCVVTNSSTSTVSGMVPGTLIEAFCADGSNRHKLFHCF